MATLAACRHGGMEDRLDLIAAALDSAETRSFVLSTKLAASEAKCHQYQESLADAEGVIEALRLQLKKAQQREQALKQEASSAQLQAHMAQEQLSLQLQEEQQRGMQLRAVREEVQLQRDDALLELANAYADIDAMQATLADSVLYVQQLRRRVVELEVRSNSAAAAAAAAAAVAATKTRDQDVESEPFSLAAIRDSINKAVQEAGQCDTEERKKRIRQLQLRWHPDKNPVLREFATEVSKIINEAVARLGDTGCNNRAEQRGRHD